MKTFNKGAIRDEKGQVLILALVLLVVGGLILTPLLGLMSTGLLAGKVYEKKMDEYYAADAGVEDAIWKIQSNNLTFVNNCSGPWHLTVNGKNVTVEIYGEDPYQTQCGKNSTYHTYNILSTAITDDSGGTAAIGSGTQIEAYITATVTYLSIMDHLVTVKGDLTAQEIKDLQNDLDKLNIPCPEGCTECEKCGQVYDYNSDAYESIPQECKGCIAVYNFPDTGWPTVSDLSTRYLQDVAGGTQYDEDTEIDLRGNSCPPGPIYINDEENNSWPSGLGPMYIDGELDIVNQSKDEATLTLTGTLYVTGETQIYGPNAAEPYKLTLDLNGQTIFVADNSSKALEIKQCNIVGPGVIVAVGDIYFAPKAESGMTDPIFVISVSGTTQLQPSGDFYGAIAGNLDVEVKLGNPNISYPAGGFGPLNFPSLFEAYLDYGIASWEISGV